MARITMAPLQAQIDSLQAENAQLKQAQVQVIKPANKTARKAKPRTKAQKAAKKLRLANEAAGRMSSARYMCTHADCVSHTGFYKPESGARHMGKKPGHEVITLK